MSGSHPLPTNGTYGQRLPFMTPEWPDHSISRLRAAIAARTEAIHAWSLSYCLPGGGGFRRPDPEGFGALCQRPQLPGGPRRGREGLRICRLECDRTRGSIGVEANSAPRPRQ
jgi:hypothetical protein